jgi:DNA polymerase
VKSEKIKKTNLLENLKHSITFYQALGFENLPIRFKKRSQLPVCDLSQIKNKEAALRALQEEIGDCRRCKLWYKRTNIVVGEGNPDAAIMFIGEAPGRKRIYRRDRLLEMQGCFLQG